MANICENDLRITCAEEDLDIIESYMKETFSSTDCYYSERNGNDSIIEFYFDSKWTFPTEMMNLLLEKLIKPEYFIGTCLSTEWGCYYCAFNESSEGKEWNEIG